MKPINIVFFLFPKTHLLDLAGPAQVFYEANADGKARFILSFVSVKEVSESAQGLFFSNLKSMKELQLNKGDLICVPGVDFKGFCEGQMESAIKKAASWIKQQHNKGVVISSICSGALILARMGMLNGVKCTTHWKCLSYMKKEFPKTKLLDNRLYVSDKNIYTSAGMTAGIDMSLAIVEKLFNPLLAAKIAQEMVINIRRAETKDQKNTFLDFKNHFNADVYKAQEILANKLEATYTIKDLADELNIGERQLARLFKRYANQTIQAYRENIRLENGEQLLYHSKLSVKEIAVKCGYESARQFTRLWKNKTNVTPIESRKRRLK